MSSAARRAGPVRTIAALAAVRARLLGDAGTEADRMLAAARAEADELLRRARGGAERAVAQARAQGRAEAAPLAAAERGRGRARARSIVLAAQREVYEELCRQTLAAAGRLRDEPGYGLLLSRLTAMAGRAAGPGATITEPGTGGVLARSGRVVVDCSLPRLAGQAVHALGDQVRDLWEP